MAPPRSESTTVRGWRAEFRLWWAMAKHVDVVFDKSPHSSPNHNLPNAGPGSISMCRACCQILSTRTCSGETKDTAIGCEFHLKRPEVPVAVRSTITSVRMREMWKPTIVVERYYLEAKNLESRVYPMVSETNFMNIAWVKRIRACNKETRRSKKDYVHGDNGCVHSRNPESIVQGLGPRYLYFKRCDGRFFNALGEPLRILEPKEGFRSHERGARSAGFARSSANPAVLVEKPNVGTREISSEQISTQDVEHYRSKEAHQHILTSAVQTTEMRGTMQDDHESVDRVPNDQVCAFNNRIAPWTAIQSEVAGPANTYDTVTELETSLVDTIKDLRRVHEREHEGLSSAELETSWQGYWSTYCARIDHKKTATDGDIAAVGPPTSDEPDQTIPSNESTSSAKSASPKSSPSACFLMPYEYAAAKQIQAESTPVPPLPVGMNVEPAKLAELAWRRLNMTKVALEEKEVADSRKARRQSRWWKVWH